VLPHQTVGEFHLVQEGLVRSMKAQRSLIDAEQVPFDRIEQLARETKGQDERPLKLFEIRCPQRLVRPGPMSRCRGN
jgi:hypothetical protein